MNCQRGELIKVNKEREMIINIFIKPRKLVYLGDTMHNG